MKLTDPKLAQELIQPHFEPTWDEKETVKVTQTTYKGKPALQITAEAMYEAPSYKGEGGLIGMLTLLRDACGGTEVTELGTIAKRGCETCDWGSLYGKQYVVWRND